MRSRKACSTAHKVISVMAVVGAEPLHDVFEPETGFLHRLVEDVEACGHVATSSKSWPERLKRAEATALTCIKRYFGRSMCFGNSRMTSVAFLSVLKPRNTGWRISPAARSEEHTSELQSQFHLV